MNEISFFTHVHVSVWGPQKTCSVNNFSYIFLFTGVDLINCEEF